MVEKKRWSSWLGSRSEAEATKGAYSALKRKTHHGLYRRAHKMENSSEDTGLEGRRTTRQGVCMRESTIRDTEMIIRVITMITSTRYRTILIVCYKLYNYKIVCYK